MNINVTVIDGIALLGFAAVIPLVLGRLPWWWAAACAALAGSFALPRGPAVVAALPLAAAAAVALRDRLRAAGPPFWWDLPQLAEVAAACYAAVAAGAVVASRWGLSLFGVHEPIVELTAVHYAFAGAGASFLAARAARGRPGSRAAVAAVLLTAGAPPLVALGFVTGSALPQVGGAVLMTLGVWCTASLELAEATRPARPLVRAGLLVSGLAVWAPMVLAVAWAAGQHWAIPVLSIHDMARTHGLANALAFVLCGLVARRLDVDVQAGERVGATR
ncbi:MAG TPA: YndJ family transporter [Acidimicrobiales bacterium]|nr:YndJ family transporter [Acidimicrobiales bacterium]